MKNRTRTLAATAVLLSLAVICCMFAFGDQIIYLVQANDKTSTTQQTNPDDPEAPELQEDAADPDRVIYYAYDSAVKGNHFFGPDRYEAAQQAVKDGKVQKELDYLATESGEGDFYDSIYHDPALCAAVALDLDLEGVTEDNPILFAEKDLLVGERADAAHLRFLQNEDQWDDAIVRIKAILTGRDVTTDLKELGDYTSGMYQIKDQLEGNKPGVVVRKTQNSGGHFIIFNVKMADGKVVTLRFRLECGYQPIDVPHWPVPAEPKPVYDNPEIYKPTPPEKKEPKPTPTPPEKKKEKPKPKNPADGIEKAPGADDKNNEWYSPDPVNHDPDTTVTPEPTSPDDYVAPEPPKQEKKKEDNKDGSKGSKSGSKTVDNDNGKQTTAENGQDATVTAGDGQDRQDFSTVVDDDPAKIEPGFEEGETQGVPLNVE